jgi:RNA polymerase sigma-70 factor (ECF subfamily)
VDILNEAELLLIKRSQKGDIDSFETLIKDYKKVAYNIALKFLRNKEDAEDVSQESLIKVFKNIEKFNMNSSFKTWMYRIVVNSCLDFKRKKKENTVSVDQPIHSGYDEFYMELEDKESSTEKIIDRKFTSEIVMGAIEKLDDDFKTVIILRDINEFSYSEISKILTCNIGTVKSRISRGRQKLKEILEENRKDYN